MSCELPLCYISENDLHRIDDRERDLNVLYIEIFYAKTKSYVSLGQADMSRPSVGRLNKWMYVFNFKIQVLSNRWEFGGVWGHVGKRK